MKDKNNKENLEILINSECQSDQDTMQHDSKLQHKNTNNLGYGRIIENSVTLSVAVIVAIMHM